MLNLHSLRSLLERFLEVSVRPCHIVKVFSSTMAGKLLEAAYHRFVRLLAFGQHED
jgi:hypothetical protein